MAIPYDVAQTTYPIEEESPLSSALKEPKAVNILAKTIHRELRANGYSEQEVMALASELLGLVADEVRTNSQPK